MPQNEQKNVKFTTVLDALKDLARPFPATYLHQFSDMGPEASKALREVWSSINLERRRSLLGDLEELADADTLVSFTEVGRIALDDEDAQVRSLAIRLLWEAEDISLVPIFIKMMENDPDANVRATAANGLGAYIYLGEIESLPANLLETIEEHLFKVYQSDDQTLVRRRALESLGYSSRKEVPALIEKAYQAGSPDWLESALFAMGRSADTSWGDDVISHLDHANPDIQYEAIRAAGELQLADARQRLLDMLEEIDDEDTLSAVVWSLSQIGGEGVRIALEGLMDEQDDDVIIGVIEEALDNLSFTEDMAIFDMFDLDMGDDASTLIDLDKTGKTGEDELSSDTPDHQP